MAVIVNVQKTYGWKNSTGKFEFLRNGWVKLHEGETSNTVVIHISQLTDVIEQYEKERQIDEKINF